MLMNPFGKNKGLSYCQVFLPQQQQTSYQGTKKGGRKDDEEGETCMVKRRHRKERIDHRTGKTHREKPRH